MVLSQIERLLQDSENLASFIEELKEKKDERLEHIIEKKRLIDQRIVEMNET